MYGINSTYHTKLLNMYFPSDFTKIVYYTAVNLITFNEKTFWSVTFAVLLTTMQGYPFIPCTFSRAQVIYVYMPVGRGSPVSIVTRYMLDGAGIESRWGWNSPHLSRPALGPTQPPIQWVPGLFPRGTVTRVWHSLPIPSSAKVKTKE